MTENAFEGLLARFQSGELHDLAAGGHVDGFGGTCDSCHHAQPNASGQACSNCHGSEAYFDEDLGLLVPRLKDAGHAGRPGDDSDPANVACAGCHQQTNEDGSWDCSQCHENF
jgi:hypothetical protein